MKQCSIVPKDYHVACTIKDIDYEYLKDVCNDVKRSFEKKLLDQLWDSCKNDIEFCRPYTVTFTKSAQRVSDGEYLKLNMIVV